MTQDPITGGCLCGGVRFTYTGRLAGELGLVTVCHCNQCRRASGYVVGVVPAETSGLTITQGSELIRDYESSPGKLRCSCSVCGSPLWSRRVSLPGEDS
jgi:hypothetical protein